MGALRLADHPLHIDHLRLRNGQTLTVRFAAPNDAEPLRSYFRGLSARSRYNRFLGAVSELPSGVLDQFIHAGQDDRFSVLALVMIDRVQAIVGEARYGFEPSTGDFEFGISVDDRWQGHGIGTVLLGNLECRAAALGAKRMFGDTLRSNDVMINLARKSGFAFTRHPDDWKLVRFEKEIAYATDEIPCASWRLVAEQRALEALA